MIEWQTPEEAQAELEAHPVYRLCHAALLDMRQRAHGIELDGLRYSADRAAEVDYIISRAVARFAVDALDYPEGMDEAEHWGVWLYSRPLGDG